MSSNWFARALNAGRRRAGRIRPSRLGLCRAQPRRWLLALHVTVVSAIVGLVASACVLAKPSHHGSTKLGARAPARYTKLVWSDEFTGPAATPPAASKWIHDTGAWGYTDDELQTYTDSTANGSLDGHGHLAIVARKQTLTGPDRRTRGYTSTRLETQGLFSAKYGLVEARMKLPAGQGLWPAFWMLGNGMKTVGWPACGEIDVIEALGKAPAVAHGFVNGPSESTPYYTVGRTIVSRTSLSSGFHTYAVRWSPNSITWLLDGVPYGTTTPRDLPAGAKWVFNQPFHLVLNLAVGGQWDGPPDASTSFPASLLVDWVRAYR
jgi:beta-glucanase (GH16 family)